MWERLQHKDTYKLMEYLENNTPNTCSIISNIKFASTSYNPFLMRGGHYYLHWSGNTVTGMIAFYNDGNVFVHISVDSAKDEVLDILTRGRFHSVWGISNWLPDVEELGEKVTMNMDARHLTTMQRDTDVQLLKNKYTLVRIDQKLYLNKYLPFIKRCLYEGFGFKPYSKDLKKRMRERAKEEPYFLLFNKNTPVAQAHIQAVSKKYGYISGICTPRKFRRMGYAKQVTSFACKFLEIQNKIPALTVNETNTAAINLYESLGFHPVDKMIVYMRARNFTGDENQ